MSAQDKPVRVRLALVHVRQVACWPWELLPWLPKRPMRYATCRTCKRDVSQPVDRAGDVPLCIYCALDSGLLPAIEEPFYSALPPGEQAP